MSSTTDKLKCATCVAWDSDAGKQVYNVNKGSQKYGMCKMLPPMAIAGNQGSSSSAGAKWPTTAESDWCMQHKTVVTHVSETQQTLKKTQLLPGGGVEETIVPVEPQYKLQSVETPASHTAGLHAKMMAALQHVSQGKLNLISFFTDHQFECFDKGWGFHLTEHQVQQAGWKQGTSIQYQPKNNDWSISFPPIKDLPVVTGDYQNVELLSTAQGGLQWLYNHDNGTYTYVGEHYILDTDKKPNDFDFPPEVPSSPTMPDSMHNILMQWLAWHEKKGFGINAMLKKKQLPDYLVHTLVAVGLVHPASGSAPAALTPLTVKEIALLISNPTPAKEGSYDEKYKSAYDLLTSLAQALVDMTTLSTNYLTKITTKELERLKAAYFVEPTPHGWVFSPEGKEAWNLAALNYWPVKGEAPLFKDSWMQHSYADVLMMMGEFTDGGNDLIAMIESGQMVKEGSPESKLFHSMVAHHLAYKDIKNKQYGLTPKGEEVLAQFVNLDKPKNVKPLLVDISGHNATINYMIDCAEKNVHLDVLLKEKQDAILPSILVAMKNMSMVDEVGPTSEFYNVWFQIKDKYWGNGEIPYPEVQPMTPKASPTKDEPQHIPSPKKKPIPKVHTIVKDAMGKLGFKEN